jgi:hypothetical protein
MTAMVMVMKRMDEKSFESKLTESGLLFGFRRREGGEEKD